MKKIILLLLFTPLLLVVGQKLLAQNALDFDGANDQVSTNYAGVLGSNARTFEAWVYVSASAPASNLAILDYGLNLAGSRNTFQVDGNRALRFISGGTNANLASANNVIPVAQWTHVAFVLNSGTGFLYVNGAQVATGNLTTVNTPAGQQTVRIGQRVLGGSILFNGIIDEVRIWDDARTAAEITANMGTEICNPTAEANLQLYFPFNQGVAGGNNAGLTTANDLSSNAYIGTLQGFALNGPTSNWVTGVPGSLLSGCTTPPMVNCATETVTPNANWPDSGAGSTGLVASVSIPVTAAAGSMLTSAEVHLDVSHSWIGDLDIELVSPGGNVMLLDSDCSLQDNIAATFSDGGAALACGTCSGPAIHENCNSSFLTCATVSGNVLPAAGTFAALNGSDPNGMWTINVTDNVGGDGGCIESIVLDLCWEEPAAPACDLVLVSVTGSSGVTCGNTGVIEVIATSSAPPIVYTIGGPVTQTNGTGNFSGLPAGTYTVDVVDQAGCATTATVTLDGDVTPPTITCPPSLNLTCFEGVPAPIDNVADWLAAGGTYTDDCPANGVTFINVNTTNGGTNCPGDALIVTRTYTVFDEAGNAATCTQTFTYAASNVGPVITSILPPCYKFCASLANPMETDITYTTDCSFDGVVTIAGPVVSGPENCPGTSYTYTYTVMDNCGRVSAPAQRAFIIGNDGPTIQCPATNLILECGDPNNTEYINEHLSQVSANTSCELGYNITHFPSVINDPFCFSSTTVVFTVTDDCQRTATCTTIVTIEDTTGPEITSTYVDGVCNEAICGSNLQFWFANWKSKVFDGLSATDNCDSFVSWTTSPNSPNPNQDCPDGTAETVVTFIANDNCGNTSGIEYSFYVVPADTSAPAGSIMGILATEETETVENVVVTLQGNNTEELFTTAADGIYGFANLALDQNYSVTPYLNEDPLNGVSSFDLVLISKHILEIQTLDSPYKMIAADINKSGSISTIDLLELRKLILHVNDEFQGNTSWRFIEAAFVFPDATNPFATLFPEEVNINGLTANEQHDFVAVKVGDVNNSAVANAVAGADDRTVVDDLVFNVTDQQLTKGETYDITFKTNNFEAVHGYQFSINFNQTSLVFNDVRAGELTNLNESNFGLTLLEEGVITTSWTNQSAQSLTRDAAVFHLSFTAKADVLLSEVMSISSRYTKAEAYNGNLDLMDVQIRFDNSPIANEFHLHQNTPNPFKQETVVGFNLPEATSATLTIYDMSGKILTQFEGNFAKGYNSIPVSKEGLAAGILYYQLATPIGTATKKMIVQ